MTDPDPSAGAPSDDPYPWQAKAATAPSSVVIASRLWVTAGVVVLLIALAAVSRMNSYAGDIVGLLFGVHGIVVIVLARNQRFGKDHRTALTVLGALSFVTIWPFLFVVPAIVLQYRPASEAWLRPPSR